jgi:hypothetical protein
LEEIQVQIVLAGPASKSAAIEHVGPENDFRRDADSPEVDEDGEVMKRGILPECVDESTSYLHFIVKANFVHIYFGARDSHHCGIPF